MIFNRVNGYDSFNELTGKMWPRIPKARLWRGMKLCLRRRFMGNKPPPEGLHHWGHEREKRKSK
jgi:hypothetical protein